MTILQLDPARAKSRNPDKLWNDPEWQMEEKLNGWRFLMHFGRDLDRTYLTGRRTSRVTGELSEKGLLVPQLWVTNTQLQSAVWATITKFGELPPTFRPDVGYTVIDGEILPPGGSGFRDIAAFMNSDHATAQTAITKHGPPTYSAFDVLYADGQHVRESPMIERRRILERILRSIRNPLIQLVPQLPPARDVYDTIVAGGGEGVILKNICAAYGESGGWIKVKRCSTLDVIVTGFTDARFGRTGRIVGQIGAARVSVRLSTGELVEVARVSGMDDITRRDMTDHPERWLGRVIEIEAQEFAKERLAHPRFRCARPDADPAHATYAKMMEDLGVDARESTRVVTGEQTCLLL